MTGRTDATKGRSNLQGTAKKRDASQTRATLAGGAMKQPVELPDGMWDRIAKKAHELWEQRGCRDGHDLQDWFDAEAIVMDEIHQARE
jgi:hypothetical protein